jgi:hypothetical protein
MIGWDGRQSGKAHHDQTLRPLSPQLKPQNTPGAADECGFEHVETA